MEEVFKIFSYRCRLKALKFLLIFGSLFTGSLFAQSGPLSGVPLEPIGHWTTCDRFEMVGSMAENAVVSYQTGQQTILTTAKADIATLGWFYLTGCSSSLYGKKIEVPQNFIEAKYWLDWAVRAGDVSAIHNLAWMYQNGLGVQADFEKAQSLYKIALDAKDATPSRIKITKENIKLLDRVIADKQEKIGRQLNSEVIPNLNSKGALMPPIMEEASACLKSEDLLKQANMWAGVAKQSLQSDPNYLKMRCRASAGIGKPLECKSPVDFFAYAGYYHSSCTTKKDYEEAKYWFELGDLGDEPSSISNLAWLFQNGLGTKKDEATAARLYKKLINLPQFSPAIKKIARENLALIPLTISESTIPPQALKAEPSKTNVESTPVQISSNSNNSFELQQFSEKGIRKALIFGNDNYLSVTKLKNAKEDASAIASALKSYGYQVTVRLDATEKEMKASIRSFSATINGGDEVLFFYAGHGVQLGAANYLLPIDIGGESEAQVRDDAIQLQRVLDEMVDRRAKFTLAVIDACRDNPFKGTGRAIGGRGLAPTTAATGQMIIFSAGVGQQALDQLGPKDPDRNGLFTRVFLREIRKPGISVDRVVRNVRNEVVNLAKSVGHEQVPAIYDQVVGEFYFTRAP